MGRFDRIALLSGNIPSKIEIEYELPGYCGLSWGVLARLDNGMRSVCHRCQYQTGTRLAHYDLI